MELTAEHKAYIEKLAGLFYVPRQIAVIMDIPVADFMADIAIETTDIYRAYWKGFYEAEVKFREEVSRLAHLGSSPAQTLLAKMIEESKMQRHER